MANTKMQKDVRFSGSGGQGVILAAIIFARAAVEDGFNATQTQSYGPESRGGYSRADAVISSEEINFPEATNLDILLSLTQEACDKFIDNLKEDGILIVDTTFVKNVPNVKNIFKQPFTKIAREELGNELCTNILSLSYVVKCTGDVTEKALEDAIRMSVKPAFLDLNLKAMRRGIELAAADK